MTVTVGKDTGNPGPRLEAAGVLNASDNVPGHGGVHRHERTGRRRRRSRAMMGVVDVETAGRAATVMLNGTDQRNALTVEMCREIV